MKKPVRAKSVSQVQEQTPIDRSTKKLLLALARDVMVNHRRKDPQDSAVFRKVEALHLRMGVFVSVYVDNELRGCIGNLDPVPLEEGIVQNAIHAAYRDTRFAPIAPEEYTRMQIHINVLSPSSPLAFVGSHDLLEKIKGKGIIIAKGARQATFLPSVWDQLPDPESFLSHLCNKAGLSFDEWKRQGLNVSIYTSEEFEE